MVYEIGKRVKDESSILHWASKNKIPMFIPGPTDGSFGSQLWSFRQMHPKFSIDILKDEDELAEIVFKTKKAGALMIGGGISKHHVIWWNQFRDGLDWAVYLTTAEEWDGSLSGARCREAVSWGKIKEKAKEVTVEGDATITLPILIGSILKK
jgi:deoxyhypusine synthase